jgi:hypothetical protein
MGWQSTLEHTAGKLKSTLGKGIKAMDARNISAANPSAAGKNLLKLIGARAAGGAIVGGGVGAGMSSDGHRTSGAIKGGILGVALSGLVPISVNQKRAWSNIGITDARASAIGSKARGWIDSAKSAWSDR